MRYRRKWRKQYIKVMTNCVASATCNEVYHTYRCQWRSKLYKWAIFNEKEFLMLSPPRAPPSPRDPLAQTLWVRHAQGEESLRDELRGHRDPLLDAHSTNITSWLSLIHAAAALSSHEHAFVVWQAMITKHTPCSYACHYLHSLSVNVLCAKWSSSQAWTSQKISPRAWQTLAARKTQTRKFFLTILRFFRNRSSLFGGWREYGNWFSLALNVTGTVPRELRLWTKSLTWEDTVMWP